MKVMCYPINYVGDKEALPLVETSEGAFLLPIRDGAYLTDELLQAFIIATRKGADWLWFRDEPIVRDETLWLQL
jgi:hypothetical protein